MARTGTSSGVAGAFLLAAGVLLARPASGSGGAAALPERCRLSPVNGQCKAMLDRYRFDAKTGRCVEYVYDGCGPVVPFETMEACRALCEPAAAPAPKAPSDATGAETAPRRPSGLAYDPVEDDPRHAEVFRKIDEEVKALLADDPRPERRGSVHVFWGAKKSLLERKYGIRWRDPGEMNPHVIFD